jgi:nucleoside-diphosphate-sugar epimerase
LLTGDLKEEISLFNLSSGISRPISDIVDALIDASSARFAVREDQSRMRPSDVPIAAVDSTRLRGATGWTPRISFAQTITDLLQDKRADVLRMG